MEDFITIRTLLIENETRLKLKLICSQNGLNRKITYAELHRPGLAISGFVELFTSDRVQIFGNTEIKYLNGLSESELKKKVNQYIEFEIPAIVVTEDNALPDYFIKAATRRYVSVLSTPLSTTQTTHLLSEYLTEKFAPQVSVHGTLVDVYGIGILLTGRSGIGKSEISLDLVERGHRLVTDDLVLIKRKSEDILIGKGTEISQHALEIRGVGLIDVARIFGIRGVRMQKRVEVEVKLVDWERGKDYERVGMEETMVNVLGVPIPQITLPIHPGKNITVIAETIAMNHLLKTYGYHGPKEFNKRLKEYMQQKNFIPLDKDMDYLKKDLE